ncbi:MAG: hypothetical protein ACOCQR_01145 [bacterium]
MARKNINTTLNYKLYKEIKFLALQQDKNANDLIEEGMKYVIDKHKKENIKS